LWKLEREWISFKAKYCDWIEIKLKRLKLIY
jgi:hypothetical protein